MGRADRKGAADTFDAAGFVGLVERIRACEELVYAPAYSRVVHESIGGVIPVDGRTRVVVLEGNYLLLPTEPWRRLRPLLDLAAYVDAPAPERVAGLIQRQREFGLTEDEALDWVYRSDEANARVVAASRTHADVVFTR